MKKLEVLYDKGSIYFKCSDQIELFNCDIAEEVGSNECPYKQGDWCLIPHPITDKEEEG